MRKRAKFKMKWQNIKPMKFKIGDLLQVKKLHVSDPINKISYKLLNIYERPYKVMDR